MKVDHWKMAKVTISLCLLFTAGLAACRGSHSDRDEVVYFDLIEKFPLAEATRTSTDGELPPEPTLDSSKTQLLLPFGTQLDYYVNLPENSVLAIDKVVAQDSSKGLLHIYFQVDGEPARPLEVLRPRKKSFARALPNPTRKFVRLSFRAVLDASNTPRPGGLAIVKPIIRTPKASGQQEDNEPTNPKTFGKKSVRPNVIIYLIDTLRADHLGSYGYDKPTSPNIDAFANGAVLFENAVAHAPWTRTSVASIFTGLYPNHHGITNHALGLPEEALTLAEVLRGSGFRTAAFVTNGTVGKKLHFDQGFHDFVTPDYLPDAHGMRAPQLSDAVNQEVFEWLDRGQDQQPFFLYVHTMDPHSPYTPPEEFRQKLAGSVKDPEMGSLWWRKQLFDKRTIPVTRSLTEKLISLYDADIAFNDHNFGVFLQQLKARGLYERSLIILVSDHGEEFQERQGWEHTTHLYAELINVPLIVKLPFAARRFSQRTQKLAQHVDIFPTVLHVVGLPIPAHIKGESLFPLDSRGDKRRPAFARIPDHVRRKGESVRVGRWKLIHQSKPNSGDFEFELYDCAADPAETKNVLEKYPVTAGYLRTLLKEHQHEELQLKPVEVQIDEALRRKLKALGYLK